MVYAAAIGKPIPDIPLSMDDYYTIYDMLNNTESNKLDFYIETPGGSGEAAEEIGKFIRNKFENISFVISGEAKSAGTILVLSGDEIYMTKTGSLGPIDAQVRIGRAVISAYDYMEWVEEKRAEAQEKGRLNPFDATMIAQISPGELTGVHNSLEFAKDIVKEWIAKYKFKSWTVTEGRKLPVTDEMKKQRAKEIARELTNHSKWRSHGRSIKIDDLESIKLKIGRLDADPKLAEIVYRIQTVIRLIFSSSNNYKIIATEKDKLFKRAVSANVQREIPHKGADVVEIVAQCPTCGKKQKVYAKFVDEPKIDEDLMGKGLKPYPKDNKLICDCGSEIDLNGLKENLEAQVGKKVIM
ncbi:Serine dehydrogenase proteinase [uncultured archaeon]|nr:Serine dehydrogenase proteinase [uncultured archaeon]